MLTMSIQCKRGNEKHSVAIELFANWTKMLCNCTGGHIGRPLVVADAIVDSASHSDKQFPKEKYTISLDADARRRYIDKTVIIGGHYPYSPTGTIWITDPVNFPSMIYIDMVNYFILGQSPFYTMKDLKNYRSLELLLSLRIFVPMWGSVRRTLYACASTQNKTCSHKHQEEK